MHYFWNISKAMAMFKSLIAVYLLLVTIHASEITKTLRRIRHHRKMPQAEDASSVDTIENFKHKLSKVVPDNSKEYWDLRLLPEHKKHSEDKKESKKYVKEEVEKIRSIKSSDDINQWKKRLQTAEVQKLIDNRMREQQFRAMDNIRKPIIPGIENIGVSINMFDMELKERVIVLNKRWVINPSSSLYARKYRIPGVLNIYPSESMKDDISTKVYQTASEYAEDQTRNFGITDVLGGYQLNKKMKEIRNLLAEGDYMFEKSRSINLYSVGLRSEYDHYISGNKEGDIVNGEMVDLPNVPQDILDQEHIDDYHKLTFINDDFLHAICPINSAVKKEKVWLPDCVLSDKYLMLDQDLGNGMNINGFFSGRTKMEMKRETEKIPLCKADDMEKILRFFNEFGTHVVVNVDVGGKITQSFHVSHDDVDLVEEDLGPVIGIQNIVNKYQEIVKDHDLGRKHGKVKNADVGSDTIDDLSSTDNSFVNDILGSSTKLASNLEDNDLAAANAAIRSETGKKNDKKGKKRRRRLFKKEDGEKEEDENDENISDAEKQQIDEKKERKFHAKKEMKFRGQKVSNNGFDGDHDKLLNNKLRDIGILKVSMDYVGGVQFPFGTKNIDLDDYSTWIDTIRKSPAPTKSNTKTLHEILLHSDIAHHCTYGVLKAEEEDKIIHKKMKAKSKGGDPNKLTDEELETVKQNLKDRLKFKFQGSGDKAGFLSERPVYSELSKHPYGRKLQRKITLIRDAMNFLRFKVHLIGQKDQERSSYVANALREYSRQEQMIWDFEKNVIAVDAEGPSGALPVITESAMWGRLKQLTEATEEISQAKRILAPLFRFQNHKARYIDNVRKLCKAESEVFLRIQRVLKGMGKTSQVKARQVINKLAKTGADPDGLVVGSDSGLLPTYEMDDVNMQSNAVRKEQLCLSKWFEKADSIMTNSFGAAKASTAILKKTFRSNIDSNCDMCVRQVNNELDPDREFGTYDFGLSSSYKFCESFPSKLKQARCSYIPGVLARSIIRKTEIRPFNAIAKVNTFSDLLKSLMNNNAEFAMYSQNINLMTGKPWRKFEIAVGICKRSMAGCDKLLDFNDYLPESNEKKTNNKGESVGTSKIKKVDNTEGKNMEGLLNELTKPKDSFDKEKAKAFTSKIISEESSGTCAKYEDIKSKYLNLKKQNTRSKMNKVCYACSKFITSLDLQVTLPAPIPNKKYKGNDILKKTTVSDGKPYLYADTESKKRKYEDVTDTVCDAKIFISDKSTLDEAKSKCGGSPLKLITGGKTSFLQVDAEAAPLAKALDIQSAGVSNPDATKALNGLKQELKRVKNGKIDCGGVTFPSSAVLEMETRLACIEKNTDGAVEAGLSQASCKVTLKTIENRLNDKLRILSASQGFPVPSKLPLPRRLALYNHLVKTMKAGGVDKSVIGKTQVSSSDDFCVAIEMCSEEQSKKMEKYWSTQLYRGQEYSHVEKENSPVLPPGFINGDSSNTKVKSNELVTAEEGFE